MKIPDSIIVDAQKKFYTTLDKLRAHKRSLLDYNEEMEELNKKHTILIKEFRELAEFLAEANGDNAGRENGEWMQLFNLHMKDLQHLSSKEELMVWEAVKQRMFLDDKGFYRCKQCGEPSP